MKKVKIIIEEIIDTLPSNEELGDSSIMETIYIFSKLRAYRKSLKDGFIEVHPDTNEYGQVYSDEFDIWFSKGEYENMF